MNQVPTDGGDKDDLEAAAIALVRASRLLADSIQADSDELIETAYALLRHARARFAGAMAEYRGRRDEGVLAA